VKALAAAFLGLIVAAWIVTAAIGTLGYGMNMGMEALAAPAMIALLVLIAWTALTRLLLPGWAFSRQELVTVAYMLLIATPLMAKSFWIPAISLVAPHAMRDQWQTYDTLPHAFRPFGDDILEGSLKSPERWTTEGAALQAGSATFARGERSGPSLALVPHGDSSGQGDAARASVVLELVDDGLRHNSYYLFTALFRAQTSDSSAAWGVTLLPDNPASPSIELVRGRGPTNPSYVHPEGFERLGNYSFRIPDGVEETVRLEIALEGEGRLEIADIELRDMTAFALTKTGAPVISRSEYERLPESRQAGMLVRPDRLVSLEGLKYLIGGTVMWGPWMRPLGWWLAFLGLFLGGALSLGLIMRRQWIERERYPLPLTIPIAEMVGRPEEAETSGRRLPAVFRNPYFWGGLALAALYCFARLVSSYSEGMAGPVAKIPLKPYLSGPHWGAAWDGVAFQILPLALGIGLLIELNVLLSLVLGYLLYRLQFWLGNLSGWDADGDYPYPDSQGLGAFVFYGLSVLVLARKHLWNGLKMAFRAAPPETELFGYRASYLSFAFCAAGLFAWSLLLGSSVAGSFSMTAVGLLGAFVYMKLRAECGAPGISWFHSKIILFVPVIGGLGAIGPLALGLNAELGRILSYYSILVVAGLQFEFVEMARRYRIRRWHLPAALAIGIAGGVFVGGWFMLGGAYATGTENWLRSTMVNPWHANVRETQSIIAQANAEMKVGAEPPAFSPSDIAFFASGGVAAALTALRQLFAGFWFHPIGFLLGPSASIANAWGSLLLAWLARLLALRLGGAATVREKLRPAAVGIIAGTIVGYAVAVAVNALIWSVSPGTFLHAPVYGTR